MDDIPRQNGLSLIERSEHVLTFIVMQANVCVLSLEKLSKLLLLMIFAAKMRGSQDHKRASNMRKPTLAY